MSRDFDIEKMKQISQWMEQMSVEEQEKMLTEAGKQTAKQMDRADRLEYLRQVTDTDFGEREKIMREFVRDAETQRRSCAKGEFAVFSSTTQPSGRLERHPGESSSGGMSDLVPISANALRIYAQHPGRVLRGEVVTPPVVIKSAQFMLKDERDSIVQVAVYGALTMGFEGGIRAIQQADSLFSVGTLLAICEPYFKTQADGSVGVRVDDPMDVITLSSLGPPGGDTIEGWKREGNVHFTRSEYDEAMWCYDRALAVLGKTHGGVSVLTNLALTSSPSKNEKGVAGSVESLGYALAAFCTAPGEGKAAYRLVEALVRQKSISAASYVSKRATSKKWAGSAVAAKLVSDAGSSSSAGGGTLNDLVLAAAEWGSSGGVDSLMDDSAGDSCEIATLEQIESLRVEGNMHFRSGNHSEARSSYLSALKPLQKDLSILLANRAECGLRGAGEGAYNALLDATAAVAINPSYAKAHHRRTRALISLIGTVPSHHSVSITKSSDSACHLGIKMCTPEDEPELRLLLARVEKAANERIREDRASKSVAGSSKPVSERERHSQSRKEDATVEELSVTNQMLTMMQTMSQGSSQAPFNLVDDTIPNFPLEFSQLGAWPLGADEGACRSHLANIYELARALPMKNSCLFSEFGVQLALKKEQSKRGIESRTVPGYDGLLTYRDLAHRLGSTSEASLKWWACAEMEDIAPPSVSSSPGYNPTIHHSFGNCMLRNESMTWGKTHAAVGFVDLGGLLYAKINGDESAGPLRWVGYDMSVYACAKTIVIAEMMRGGAPSSCVVQAWFSAAWTTTTARHFRASVDRCLGTSGKSPPKDTLHLLRHWSASHNVPLRTARAGWLAANTGKSVVPIPDCKIRSDRLALCSYEISGQLGHAEVGSAAMFALPDGIEVSMDESFLHVISLDELLLERLKSGINGNDFITAGIAILERHVGALAAHIARGAITIECRHKAVDMHVSKEVAELKPWTMSWSNVSDYFDTPTTFHACASSCSRHGDTIHSAYSMNWPRTFKGAYCIDYPKLEMRMELKKAAEEAVAGMYSILPLNDHAFPPRAAGLHTARDLLRCPPVSNALNTCDSALCAQYGAVWLEKSFFRSHRGRPLSNARPLARPQPTFYNPFARGHSTVFTTFTYDEDIVAYDAAETELVQ